MNMMMMMEPDVDGPIQERLLLARVRAARVSHVRAYTKNVIIQYYANLRYIFFVWGSPNC